MKKLVVLFMICCMVTACGKGEDVNVGESTTTVETEETLDEEQEEVAEETVNEEQDAVTVSPLPCTIDMNALDNCTLAVSFEKGDAYVDDTGAMRLDVTVYTYDLYDMVDMAILKEGDTMVIGGEDVLVESLERLESGAVLINGGIENGGYDFGHNESGVYFEHGMSDVKSYYPIGEASMKVSADFEFIDSSDLDNGETIYHQSDFLTDDAGIFYHFTPNNTSIVVEDGMIIQMTRVYTPQASKESKNKVTKGVGL